MATLFKEVHIAASPETIWSAARDIEALHTKLVPGFVVDTRVDDDRTRTVTFGNGMVVRELVLSVDDARKRLAWTLGENPLVTHYNAVLEIRPDGEGTRVSWTTDLLPDAAAPQVSEMQDQGLGAMKRAFTAAGI